MAHPRRPVPGHPRQRMAAPQRQRLPQQSGAFLAADVPGGGDQAPKPVQVDQIGLDAQQVPAGLPLHAPWSGAAARGIGQAEQATDVCDVAVQCRLHRGGWSLVPDPVDERLAGDQPPHVDRERGQHRSALWSADGDCGAAVGDHLYRPQQTQFHHISSGLIQRYLQDQKHHTREVIRIFLRKLSDFGPAW